MDRNTFIGLILMAAVIFGFSYLNRPSAEEIERQRREALEQAEEQNRRSESDAVLTVDSLNPAEAARIAATVRELGVADSLGTTSLDLSGLHLTLDSDGQLGGYVEAGAATVDILTLIDNRWNELKPSVARQAVETLRNGLRNAAKYRGFARYLTGDSTTVTLANKLISINISNKGGVIAEASLNDYKSFDSTLIRPISPETDTYGFTLTSSTQRFDTREFYFTPIAQSDSTVTMQLDLGDGATFGIRYTLHPDSYLVTMDVIQQGMQSIIPSSVASMDFSWSQKMRRNEAGRVFEERNSALYYMFIDGDVNNLSESGTKSKSFTDKVKWIGYKNQFFSSVLMARTCFSSADLTSQELENDPLFIKQLSSEMTMEYSPALANPASFTFYLGPNLYPLLDEIQTRIYPEEDMHLTKLIPLGWPIFRWINTLIIIPVFTFLGHYISNYGIIILILTLFIKLILFPFTYKSFISQARMRLLAPEINAINEKYPGNENAMRRQQETMALYSRAGANPMSGCLPLLLQMPILVAMFSFFPSAIELRGEHFLWAHDLSAPDAIISWNFNIPFISSTFGNHISLFCLLMTVTNIIYTKINMASQPSTGMPGMKWMMYLMPLMFLFIFNNYASGLSYYYFLSLLITIIQTYIMRRVVSEDKMRAKMAENAKKPRKKSGFMARLEEMQRQQQAQLRAQEKQRRKK
ncbi:MAG: membrane protein insertase YidC [Lachnoclostridium sp.]|nr:membrane protein insertase YidC [Lachnoclostridium sp.]